MRDMHFPWPARAEAKIDQSAPGMSRGTWLDSAAPCFRQATVVPVAAALLAPSILSCTVVACARFADISGSIIKVRWEHPDEHDGRHDDRHGALHHLGDLPRPPCAQCHRETSVQAEAPSPCSRSTPMVSSISTTTSHTSRPTRPYIDVGLFAVLNG